MNRERFEQVLEAYGADPRRWPETERAAALAYRDAHASEETAALAEASEIDALLEVARETQAPSDLVTARILKAAPKRTHAGIGWRPIAALAACAVFGVVMGFSAGSLAPSADAAEEALGALFSSPLSDGGEG